MNFSKYLGKYLKSVNKTEVHSDSHILASLDFDLLIGYPKKTSNGSLDEEVGKIAFAKFITHP